ncbi:plastocyanin/azurin family copper-binding protein [Nitrosococcus wardiae]|uniref:Blue (type 1) copper domain-containing protein n=1 Tax=Nitrosococcus wardiae TaxID=1814290 RepID=A0A4P7BYA4_9GAMM|nr:plastocyanin/azurin family copper-binding protein [Nitrosococcus wardiae]QBQ54317.1 hypothetical protein E3U44_07195 [Nitrosococcus wardiae]
MPPGGTYRHTFTVPGTYRYFCIPHEAQGMMGETVPWESQSVLVHTVTAVPAKAARAEDVALPRGAEPFNSGLLGPGETFQHTFTVKGTYRYFCIPHEAAGMVGEVIIQ